MEIPCRLKDVEEIISGMELFYIPDDILECDAEYQIVVSGWWVNVPELRINFREGVFCNYDEAEKAYLPEFSITVIMQAGEEPEGGWLYYEQDGFEITVANYFGGRMGMDDVSELSCLIFIPDNELKTE